MASITFAKKTKKGQRTITSETPILHTDENLHPTVGESPGAYAPIFISTPRSARISEGESSEHALMVSRVPTEIHKKSGYSEYLPSIDANVRIVCICYAPSHEAP